MNIRLPKFIRLTVYSYLRGHELFHQIALLSQNERSHLKNSKIIGPGRTMAIAIPALNDEENE
jgi:hypothetical protein